MSYVNYVELSFDTTDGHHFTVELSPTQLSIMCKVLGIEFNSDGTMNCFSDDTLQQIKEMKGNPLRLKEK